MNELLAITQDEAWQSLTPNHPTGLDLVPRDLWPSQIEQVVLALQDMDITRGIIDPRNRAAIWEDAPAELKVPGVYKFEKVGFGESRICYKLTTRRYMSMAVLFGGYAGKLGLQVPQHPNFTCVDDSPTRRLWEYSDLRTYLCIPTSATTGVTFREFGGEPALGARYERDRAAARLRTVLALSGLQNANPDITKRELSKPHHYLVKKWRTSAHGASVIDIPLEERLA